MAYRHSRLLGSNPGHRCTQLARDLCLSLVVAVALRLGREELVLDAIVLERLPPKSQV